MTTEPCIPAEPQHKLYALTTGELSRYRKELEHALVALPERATVRPQLQLKLDAVLAEVEDRARLASA